MKIGIIREGKTPPDERVALSPEQCAALKAQYPLTEVVIQPSPIRKFRDEEYVRAGLNLQEDLSECDILLGVKEVPSDMLIAGKTYLFFSHTFKLQPYNAKLLKTLLEKKIRLIDYEVLKDKKGIRILGFGRYAGIVGCYNGFRAYGLKHRTFTLKPANACENRKEMEKELRKVRLPKNFKCVLTGYGRVGHGAREIMALLPVREISHDDYLKGEVQTPSFTQLDVEHYNKRKDGQTFDKALFFKNPHNHESAFLPYLLQSDVYIACHYWAEGAPFLFSREDAKHPQWRTSVIADISCDIDGPVASTLRPSTIANPLYGYDRYTEKECDWQAKDAICVMAVDNLPCELPKDASIDFGRELMDKVLPVLLGKDPDGIIERATETTLEGKLGKHFEYLKDYAAKA